jgi:hypothetical protein
MTKMTMSVRLAPSDRASLPFDASIVPAQAHVRLCRRVCVRARLRAAQA